MSIDLEVALKGISWLLFGHVSRFIIPVFRTGGNRGPAISEEIGTPT